MEDEVVVAMTTEEDEEEEEKGQGRGRNEDEDLERAQLLSLKQPGTSANQRHVSERQYKQSQNV